MSTILSGIYKITLGPYYYIGSSKNVAFRIKAHEVAALKNKHCNNKLQKVFNSGNYSFNSEVLELVEENLLSAEQKYLDQLDYNSPYVLNICRIAGGGYLYPETKIKIGLAGEKSGKTQLLNEQVFTAITDFFLNTESFTKKAFINFLSHYGISSGAATGIYNNQTWTCITKQFSTGFFSTHKPKRLTGANPKKHHLSNFPEETKKYHVWASGISGLTEQEYCQSVNLKVSTLTSWKRKQRKDAFSESFLNKKLIFLVGPSKAGKDTAAKSLFKYAYNFKCNSHFKKEFELESELPEGYVNIQANRAEVLTKGPYSGLTISDAMVKAYLESIENKGHGAKYQAITTQGIFEDFLSNRDLSIVVTDCRKTSEMLILLGLAKQFNFQPVLYVLDSNIMEIKKSDLAIKELIKCFSHNTEQPVYTLSQIFHKNYV